MKTFIRSSPWMRLPRTTLCKINISTTDRFSELLGFFPPAPGRFYHQGPSQHPRLLPDLTGSVSVTSHTPASNHLPPQQHVASAGLLGSPLSQQVAQQGLEVGGGGISHQTPRHTHSSSLFPYPAGHSVPSGAKDRASTHPGFLSSPSRTATCSAASVASYPHPEALLRF